MMTDFEVPVKVMSKGEIVGWKNRKHWQTWFVGDVHVHEIGLFPYLVVSSPGMQQDSNW